MNNNTANAALKFMCRVRVSAKLVRQSKSYPIFGNDGHKRGEECLRFWKAVAIEPAAEGWFLGYRTLTNGTMKYDAFDGDYLANRTTMRVALVVFNEKLNPVYVSLDEIEQIEDVARDSVYLPLGDGFGG